MALFQPAPKTQEEVDASKPLDIPPEQVLAFEESEWYARAYRGENAPQLTVRAVLVGSILGFFLAFTNLYIGLKTGWHLGVAITACILSFSVWTTLTRLKVAKTPMTILENNCMQSTASSAGYSTGGTLVSAFPALLMLSVTPSNPNGTHLHWAMMAAWTFCIAILGTVLAIPMKRNMINRDKLKFPSGVASAVTLQSLYSQGAEALAKARALFIAGGIGMTIPLLKDLMIKKSFEGGKLVRSAIMPGSTKIFDWLPKMNIGGKQFSMSDFNVKLDNSFALVAAGALSGLRVTISMMTSALTLVFYVAPLALRWFWENPNHKVVAAALRPASAWKDIGLWIGAPMLVGAGLTSFAFQWRTIGRAILSMTAMRKAQPDDEIVQKTEVPTRWFMIGGGGAATGVIMLAWIGFGIPPYFGVLAVLMTFFLALVACRATGETDITPTGAMGKIMQLTYGVLIPQSTTANLMTASITAGSASASADLLNDLKSGYLLGANPRRQFIAQLSGVLSGTVATTIGYFILVPNATALTGKDGQDPAFAAPAAQQWKAVAEIFKLGFGNLHPMARWCIVIGVAIGVTITIVEQLAPKQKKYMLSPTGMGLGFVLPFYYALAMFLGAVLAAVYAKVAPKSSTRYTIPIVSGLIAGESIIGVIVQAINNFVLT